MFQFFKAVENHNSYTVYNFIVYIDLSKRIPGIWKTTCFYMSSKSSELLERLNVIGRWWSIFFVTKNGLIIVGQRKLV